MNAQEIKEMETVIRVVLGEVLEDRFGERLETIETLLKKHEETLYGNGKTGLIEIAHRNASFVDGFYKILQSVAIALAITLVTGLIVLVVTHGQLGTP